jgi:primosomal protein N' (replication factor Y)
MRGMFYYEVYVADSKYHSGAPLTYSSEQPLKIRIPVTVPLRNRMVTGFIAQQVDKPRFAVKPIKNLLSDSALPHHCLDLAKWMSQYYACSLGEALKQFAPTKPTLRKVKLETPALIQQNQELQLDAALTAEQTAALAAIEENPNTTVLLHGDTGSGKTRVYIELAKRTLQKGQSAIILTPEIALTAQLAHVIEKSLGSKVIVLHSQLTQSSRKKMWLQILESQEPLTIIGPRSALFSPVQKLGLVVIDEAHEPAYKQDQTPRYHAIRVASVMGNLAGAKIVLGSATPSLVDYYLAETHNAVVEMKNQAITGTRAEVEATIIDLKDRVNFSINPYLSNQLIDGIKQTLSEKKQVLIFFNRRGTARLMLCSVCGWQLLCPNCHIPLIYHGDSHSARCHICGHGEKPPLSCPVCSAPDIIYKSVGTKAIEEILQRLFPEHSVQRFDSDNLAGERIDELYPEVFKGEIDILIGTQLLAKGFDLPKLGLVGVISAEASLTLPDYTTEERAFQLMYQVIGRVGRGHGGGRVIIQTYHPYSSLLTSAIARDWGTFYNETLQQRQQFKFPPYSYLMQIVGRRATLKGMQEAAANLKAELQKAKLPVEIIGPAPSFYERRGNAYYWQIVVKSKNRTHLTELAKKVPAGWMIDLDPVDLL